MKTAEKKLTAIFGVALILLMALSSTAYAITGNYEPDDGRHPYVGLLVFDVYDPILEMNMPAWRCTGSLIAPDVVLCAGHCCDGAVAARVWFDEDITYDNVPFPLYPYGGPGSGAIEGAPYTNPEYRTLPGDPPGNGIPTFSYRDVGIVVLDEPVYMDEYAELPTAGLVDTLTVMTDVDLVGYGVQYQVKIPGNELPSPPPYYRWAGPRFRFYAPAQLLSGEFSWSDEFVRCTANPGRGKGGTAFGDSGGPVLLGGTNTILAVNSYVTNINCKGTTYHSRIDIPDVLTWIQGFLP
jgi:hypothetical protein